jgi:hypothetical protein
MRSDEVFHTGTKRVAFTIANLEAACGSDHSCNACGVQPTFDEIDTTAA